MIGILIEINGLHQLNKMDSGTVAGVHRQILALMDNEELEQYVSRNCLYIQLPFRDSENRRLWESLREVYNFLFSRREEYQGFLVMLDYCLLIESFGILKIASKKRSKL